jgi:trehalose-phosphatase
MESLLESESFLENASSKLQVSEFLKSVAVSGESALMLDFDGTLAPFRIDPKKVRPWPGIRKLLQEIQDAGRTRIVIVSGRPALDVERQLALHTPLEIFGAHGAERLFPNGQLVRDELLPEQRQALIEARRTIHSIALKPGIRVEEKWNAIAMHWRGASAQSIQSAQTSCADLFRPFAEFSGIQILPFDGGVELRAGRNKGNAVLQLLTELHSDSPVAYLGDDATDEDAFHALGNRGMGVLVKSHSVPSAAQLWLRPPYELLNFLALWQHAVKR